MSLKKPEICVDYGVKLDSEAVALEYSQIQTSFDGYFRQSLLDNPVDLIVLGNGNWSTKKNLGFYQSDKNGIQINIYPDLIEESVTYGGWREILAHETGHALHNLIVGDDLLDSSAEAFADLAAVVGYMRNDTRRMKSFLGLHLALNPGRKLFGGKRGIFRYPSDSDRKTDAALLHFIKSTQGVNRMVLTSALPVIAQEQSALVLLNSAQHQYIDLQKGQTSRKLEQEIKDTIGMDRKKLLRDAHKWYDTKKY